MANNKEQNLGRLSQVPPGEGRVFVIGGVEIAVFHDRHGGVYAVEPRCPHAGGPLADGLVGAGTVVCPLHERCFDLATGESSNSDCRIRVYPARLNDKQEILVSLG